MTTEFQRGMRRAAQIAELYADENMRMADDTVALDPILNRAKRAQIRNQAMLDPATMVSENLAMDGFAHAERYHAGTDIAGMIRQEAREAKPRRRKR
jgi:hypothetical protein